MSHIGLVMGGGAETGGLWGSEHVNLTDELICSLIDIHFLRNIWISAENITTPGVYACAWSCAISLWAYSNLIRYWSHTGIPEVHYVAAGQWPNRVKTGGPPYSGCQERPLAKWNSLHFPAGPSGSIKQGAVSGVRRSRVVVNSARSFLKLFRKFLLNFV